MGGRLFLRVPLRGGVRFLVRLRGRFPLQLLEHRSSAHVHAGIRGSKTTALLLFLLSYFAFADVLLLVSAKSELMKS